MRVIFFKKAKTISEFFTLSSYEGVSEPEPEPESVEPKLSFPLFPTTSKKYFYGITFIEQLLSFHTKLSHFLKLYYRAGAEDGSGARAKIK